MIIIDDFEVPYIPKQGTQKDTYSLLEKTENSDFIGLNMKFSIHRAVALYTY